MWWRRRKAQDFAEEIEAHLQLEADRLRAEGLSEEEANAAARRAFGNVTRFQERFFESTRAMWLNDFMQDARYAARVLRKNPGFTLTAVLVLALGSGANSAVFSFISSLLLQPLPFPDQHRLVTVREAKARQGFRIPMVAPADFMDWQRETRAFEHFSAYAFREYTLTGGKNPAAAFGVLVSAGFFQALGVQAAIGRTFLPDEEKGLRGDVAVISHGLWKRHFGGNAALVGQTISVDRVPRTLVGVMPPGFEFPFPAVEIWTPLNLSAAERMDRRERFLVTVARLRPGISLGAAQFELGAVARRLEAAHPQTNAGRGVRVVPMQDQLGDFSRPFLLLLQAAALLVLIVGCANVANLQLSQATRRSKEMAMRSALGANRWRLVRLMLMESLLLTIAGATAGAALAHWGVQTLKTRVPASTVRYLMGWNQIALDWQVLAFALAVTVLCGTLFGLSNAFPASRLELMPALREGSACGQSVGKARLRHALVVAQLILAVVLVIAASQAIRGFHDLFAAYKGFSPESLTTARIVLAQREYATPAKMTAFYDRLLHAVGNLPGVSTAAVASSIPGGIRYGLPAPFEVEGRIEESRAQDAQAETHVVSDGYFRAMFVSTRAGRGFTAQDRAGSAPVAVISEALARRYFDGVDPIGRRIRLVGWAGGWRTIVGMVADVRQNWSDRTPRPAVYLSCAQAPRYQMNLLIRASGDLALLLPAIRLEIGRIDPDVPVLDAKPLRQVIDEGAAGMAVASRSMEVFGTIALALAILGVYGVMSQAVLQRKREFAIRIALGATPHAVLRLVLRQAAWLTSVGIVVGLAGGLFATRMMAGLLYGLSSTSVTALVVVPVEVAATALVACYVPARAGMRVDPMQVLRQE